LNSPDRAFSILRFIIKHAVMAKPALRRSSPLP
jgi:hypothetical protein